MPHGFSSTLLSFTSWHDICEDSAPNMPIDPDSKPLRQQGLHAYSTADDGGFPRRGFPSEETSLIPTPKNQSSRPVADSGHAMPIHIYIYIYLLQDDHLIELFDGLTLYKHIYFSCLIRKSRLLVLILATNFCCWALLLSTVLLVLAAIKEWLNTTKFLFPEQNMSQGQSTMYSRVTQRIMGSQQLHKRNAAFTEPTLTNWLHQKYANTVRLNSL